MHPRMSVLLCVVLFCVGTGLSVGRFPVQGTLPNCLNGFMVFDVNSETEQAKGPNPCNVP